jgi:hypothetical protein
MFIIDNSGSMSGLGSAPNDQMGSRFSVTLALLDEIYARVPDAEVGVAVFENILYFDNRDDPFFTQLPGNVDGVRNQSYIPLTRLDQQLSDGTLGIEKLKEVMAIDTSRGTLYDGSIDDYVHLRYIPSDMSNHTMFTNINVGFEAAKEAFRTASYPEDRQFIIFLSDGEPMGSMQAGLPSDYFEQGENVPTTFTVFFTPDTNAPQSLLTMTTNIRNNGYSETNPESDLWTIQTSHDALLSLIIDNIFETIIFGQPNSMTVTGIDIFDTTTTYVDSFFLLNDRIPLESDVTPFELQLSFRYIDQTSGQVRDTLITTSFYVKREPDSLPTPPEIEYSCWQPPTLQILYADTQVSQVSDDMRQLEIRLTTSDPRITEVTIAVQSSIDSESVVLTNTGEYWSGTITRSIGASAISGDGNLDHQNIDSIIVVYRNPDLPLDTVRLAVPFIPPAEEVPVVAILRDTNANGQFDRLDIIFPDTVTLRQNLPAVQEIIQSGSFVNSDGEVVQIQPIDVQRYDDTTLHITLRENNESSPQTGWQTAQIDFTDVSLTTNGNSAVVVKITDSAGPVIKKAVLFPGADDTDSDTLRVTFSEPVDCQKLMETSPESVFVYLDGGIPSNEPLRDAEFGGSCSGTYQSEAIILVPNSQFEIIPWEDSLSIRGGSQYVVDSSGTLPPANGRKASIELEAKNVVELAVFPNPIVADKEIDSRILQAYSNVVKDKTYGAVIGVHSLIPLKEVSVGSNDRAYGKAEIYDAVGNLVQSSLPVEGTGRSGVYGIYWNVKNRNERLVGNGTYLLIVTTTDINDAKSTRRIKLGVQR